MKIITGNANIPFAKEVSSYLDTKLTLSTFKKFADGEVFVEIEENVRGEDCFIIQPTSTPANDHLMELLIGIDALKRGSAKRITAVIPYFGYARQDRKTGPRTPITAKLVANLISIAGADRILTMDLHAIQIQGFFDIPVDNLYATPVLANNLKTKINELQNPIVVSPDVGGVARARSFAKRLDLDIAIIDKRREKAGVSEVMHVVGDVKNRHCILLDDIIDSAGTLCNAAKALIERGGACGVSACASHGVLSNPAIERIEASVIDEVLVTNTIMLGENAQKCSKINQVSVAPLIGEAISRICENRSVSSLFT